MAGMLPGVECARWRRSHQSRDPPSSAAHTWTRRSSFCLYATSNDNIFHNSSIPSLESERSRLEMESEDEKLGGVARKAKDRLDEKLRSKRKSDDTITRRQNSKERVVVMGSNGELQTDGVKKSSSGRVKKFNWGRVLRWKEGAGGGQDESTSISVAAQVRGGGESDVARDHCSFVLVED